MLVLAAVAALVGLTGCAQPEEPTLREQGISAPPPSTIAAEECAPIRAIVDPIVVDLPTDDTPAPASTLAAAPAAVAALEALPDTSTTAGLLRDFFVADFQAMANSGEVPTSLISDLERLDRYCPAG